MDKQAEDAWNPEFREAVKEVLSGQGITYKTQHEISLEKCSDTEPWQASEQIKDIVLNIDDVTITMMTDSTDLNEINEVFIREGKVGIVLMGHHISRFVKPSLLVMATKSRFYAIFKPDDKNRGIQFLKAKLYDTRISYYTTNGLNENDCLYHNCGIDLAVHPNVNCCTGLNIVILRHLRNTTRPRKSQYPSIAANKAQAKLKMETFENLIECWLDIPKEDIMFRPNQIVHLDEWPLTMTAKNIIKKRCVLVLPLAMELETQAKRDVLDISQIIYNKLPTIGKHTRRIYEDIFIETNPQDGKVRSLLTYLAGV